ncbi:MAG TPA: tol-pal system protein YbgF [Azospirillaceae bacterium]|nr:tol-pal system protein YbgF [Azospirillaceae bacterium]
MRFPRMPARARLAATAVLGLAVLAGSAQLGPAAAQSGDLRELLNRLNRLETEVQTLQRQSARGGSASGGAASGGAVVSSAPAGSAAAYEVRITQLEDVIRTMTGRVEENEFAARQLRERLDRLSSDIEFRLSQIEEKVSAQATRPAASATPAPQAQSAPMPAPSAPAQSPPAQASRPPQSAPAQAAPAAGTPEEMYNAAYRNIEQRQLAQAQQGFEQFLQRHKTHKLAENARYWLAETHYARGQFDQAAVAFAEAYQAAPRGEKAADNLLKLGLSLSQLRRRDDACNTFNALQQQFPNLPTTQRQRVQQERSKLNCVG